MTTPSDCASPSISSNASLPCDSVLTRAVPSESNSLNAKRKRSDSLVHPQTRLQEQACAGRAAVVQSRASTFNSRNAPLASPVPTAASAVLRVNRWSAMFIVLTSTPVSCPAYCKALNASVVVLSDCRFSKRVGSNQRVSDKQAQDRQRLQHRLAQS